MSLCTKPSLLVLSTYISLRTGQIPKFISKYKTNTNTVFASFNISHIPCGLCVGTIVTCPGGGILTPGGGTSIGWPGAGGDWAAVGKAGKYCLVSCFRVHASNNLFKIQKEKGLRLPETRAYHSQLLCVCSMTNANRCNCHTTSYKGIS